MAEKEKKKIGRPPAKVVCVVCEKEILRKDMVLHGNKYHCKGCLPKGGAPDKPDIEEIEAVDKDDQLKGMRAISQYAQRSECTLIGFINSRAFPADKLGTHQWHSGKKAIDKWWASPVGKDSI